MATGAYANYRKWVRSELDACITFWLENGQDKENGGVYTCLDRKGEIYSTDKSVWMQGRCAWMFANLCRVYGIKEEWMVFSRSCLEFLEKHCINRAAGGRMYFTVTGDGKPLRQRRYAFSEAFYALANAEYYGLTGEKECLERARFAYKLFCDINEGNIIDPTGFGPKTISETRTLRGLGYPMICLNLIGVLRRVDPENAAEYDAKAKACTNDIFAYHFKPDLRCTLEVVEPNGTPVLDVTEGRMVNPGHDIECAWFVMEDANQRGDKAAHAKACEMMTFAFEGGWDKEYGGILYFVDCLGKPPEAYEHDMKLWWPHNEALIASLMAYRDTGDAQYFEWFEKTMDYCKKYFADPENGEWYGYLRRDGEPTQPSTKGSTFKGPFHLPRALVILDTILAELEEKV